jgi:integrase
MNIPERELIGGRSVKETLNYTKSLYKWLVRRSTVTLNPFEGVMTATSSQSYEPFTDTQVSKIFSSELYTSVPALTTTPGHWWLLLMSLYSGARPSELVQLTLDDVVEEQGVLVMRIVADEAKGQSVKTKAGQRVVPVHPKLLELGFADFIERSRVAGKERVLHGISKGKAQSGGPAGVWFKRYKQFHLPELEEQRKPLYSFRSTFVTHALNVANIDLAYVQQIVGHERSQMGTTRVYDAGGDAKRLFEEISKVKFKLPPIKPVTA